MNYGIMISLIVAYLHNRFTKWMTCCDEILPKSVSADVYLNWKWRNFFISFIHACITGIGSLLCIFYEPKLITDVIETYIEVGYILTCFSHGYFIYDTIEMIENICYKGCKELILHHIIILLCFSITVIEHKYVGYCCIALLIEISNIFLHFRQLLLIANVSKNTLIYRINSVINIATFITIRGLCLFWLWYSLIICRFIVPIIPKLIAFVSLCGISIMTSILLFRVVVSDFIKLSSSHKNLKNKIETNTNTNACNYEQLPNDQMGDEFSPNLKTNDFMDNGNDQRNDQRKYR